MLRIRTRSEKFINRFTLLASLLTSLIVNNVATLGIREMIASSNHRNRVMIHSQNNDIYFPELSISEKFYHHYKIYKPGDLEIEVGLTSETFSFKQGHQDYVRSLHKSPIVRYSAGKTLDFIVNYGQKVKLGTVYSEIIKHTEDYFKENNINFRTDSETKDEIRKYAVFTLSYIYMHDTDYDKVGFDVSKYIPFEDSVEPSRFGTNGFASKYFAGIVLGPRDDKENLELRSQIKPNNSPYNSDVDRLLHFAQHYVLGILINYNIKYELPSGYEYIMIQSIASAFLGITNVTENNKFVSTFPTQLLIGLAYELKTTGNNGPEDIHSLGGRITNIIAEVNDPVNAFEGVMDIQFKNDMYANIFGALMAAKLYNENNDITDILNSPILYTYNDNPQLPIDKLIYKDGNMLNILLANIIIRIFVILSLNEYLYKKISVNI